MKLNINGITIQIDGDNISITTPGASASGKVGYVSNTIDPPNFAYGHVARQCRAFVKATKVKSTIIESHCAATVKAALSMTPSSTSCMRTVQ